jgi:hypothetical protein
MTALHITRKTPDDTGTVAEKPADLPRRLPAGPPFAALDDRVAGVGTIGSGKTDTAKGLVKRLLTAGTRVAMKDPTRRSIRANTLPTAVVAGLLVAGQGQPTRTALASFICTNPGSAATWEVQVDFDRSEADGFPGADHR